MLFIQIYYLALSIYTIFALLTIFLFFRWDLFSSMNRTLKITFVCVLISILLYAYISFSISINSNESETAVNSIITALFLLAMAKQLSDIFNNEHKELIELKSTLEKKMKKEQMN